MAGQLGPNFGLWPARVGVKGLDVGHRAEIDPRPGLAFGHGVGHGPQQMGLARTRRAANQKRVVAHLAAPRHFPGQGQGKGVFFVGQKRLESEPMAVGKVRDHGGVGGQSGHCGAHPPGAVAHGMARAEVGGQLALEELLDRPVEPGREIGVGENDATRRFAFPGDDFQGIEPAPQVLLRAGARKMLAKVVFEHAVTGCRGWGLGHGAVGIVSIILWCVGIRGVEPHKPDNVPSRLFLRRSQVGGYGRLPRRLKWAKKGPAGRETPAGGDFRHDP